MCQAMIICSSIVVNLVVSDSKFRAIVIFRVFYLVLNPPQIMQPLDKTKRVLTWLGIFPLNEFSSKREKVAVIVVTLVTFATSLASSVASLLFFMEFWKIDPKDSLFAACGVVAFCSICYILITVFFLRRQISAIFDELLVIYDASKYVLYALEVPLCMILLQFR